MERKSFWAPVLHVMLQLHGLTLFQFGFKVRCSLWGLGSNAEYLAKSAELLLNQTLAPLHPLPSGVDNTWAVAAVSSRAGKMPCCVPGLEY